MNKKSFKEAKEDKEFWGPLVEFSVGSYLLNESQKTEIDLYYWREKDKEVDFVLKKGSLLTAIEVKTSYKKEKFSGLQAFPKAYNPDRILIIGKDGISLEEFLKEPIENWI